MKVRWRLLGSKMNTWIWNTTSISEKPFEQKLKCTVCCNIIHLLQLLKKLLGFWQPFVDKDPIPPWHHITADSKDSLNKVLRLQPLGSTHISMSAAFGSEPTMSLLYNTGKAHLKSCNLAGNIKEMIERILAKGFTQLPIHRKLFFPRKLKNGEIWFNDSENTPAGHRAISSLSRVTNVSEQRIWGHRWWMWDTPLRGGIRPSLHSCINVNQLSHNELFFDVLLKFEQYVVIIFYGE